MTDDHGDAPGRRQLVRTVLARHAEATADAAQVAAAAKRAYDDLARVLAPVIGDLGVAALTDRALHLATREYPWLPFSEAGAADTRLTKVVEILKRQDEPALAAAAATAVFETILRLLATFIGEPLAARLVQEAWPDALSVAGTEET